MLVLWQLYDDVYNRKSTRVEIRRHSFEFLLQYLPGAWILVNYLYPLIHSCLLWKWNGLPMSENSCDVVLGDICQSTYNSWHIFLKENLFVIIPLFFFFGYFLQKVSEKVGGAEGTKLDDDFKEMERVSLHHLDSLDIKSPSILRGEARKEGGSCSPRAPENAKVTPKSTLFVMYIVKQKM